MVHSEGDDSADIVDFDPPNNRHDAFAGRIHRCRGSHLARLELRVSRKWHRPIPECHVPPEVDLAFSAFLRQVEHLPIVFNRNVS